MAMFIFWVNRGCPILSGVMEPICTIRCVPMRRVNSAGPTRAKSCTSLTLPENTQLRAPIVSRAPARRGSWLLVLQLPQAVVRGDAGRAVVPATRQPGGARRQRVFGWRRGITGATDQQYALAGCLPHGARRDNQQSPQTPLYGPKYGLSYFLIPPKGSCLKRAMFRERSRKV